MKVAFVILNYQNYKDTVNCVESILRVQDNSSKIFVIDNCSPDGSGKKIREKFSNKIETVLLDKNYGFSRANNIGYELAKKWGADMIAVLNNDVLVEGEDFMKVLKKNSSLEILVPDIVNAKGQHQNPMRFEALSRSGAKRQRKKSKVMSWLLGVPGIRKMIYAREQQRQAKWEESYYNDEKRKGLDFQNFVPHGAFIVFGKKWVERENEAFPSKTFMYLEEDSLTRYALERGYTIRYCPELKVKHLEGRSTIKAVGGDGLKKMRLKFQQQAQALDWYLGHMV